VIVAVPFITITDQNARQYRDLLDPEDESGGRVVLEHH
jgi:CRISPR-associated endonuclease/helicase Cas3